MRLHNTWLNRALVVLLLGYGGFVGLRILAPQTDSAPVASRQGGVIKAYFTNPGGAGRYTLRGGPDTLVAAAIDQATDSVQLAAYDLDLWSVRDALIRAYERGVEIRVVMESSGLEGREAQDLVRAGIEIRGDGRPPLMHDKFLVVDGREVWTGSMNFTVNGAYRNNNNLIQIDASEVASLYAAEFDEMFQQHEFGRLSGIQSPAAPLELDGVRLEVWFAPDQPVAARIVELIEAAEHSIELMAFNLTSDPIADALLEAAQRSVRVRGVFETTQASNQGSDLERLAQAGIEVVYDATPRNMHHKVIVIDDRVVITGSYNFSRSAEEQNDENLLVIFSPELAEQYLIEFRRLRTEGLR